MLAALNGNPEGRTDMGLEWRLVAQQAPSPKRLIEAPVGALEVNGRTRSALQKAGIATVRELARMTEAEWRAIPGISENGAQEILTALHKHENVKPKALVEKVRSNEAEVTA
jgi:DNA-directed RNA polymerase alpha subunit